MVESYREVIDAYWRSADEMATDVGVTIGQGRHWKTRDGIPCAFWLLVEKAIRRKRKGRKIDLVRAFARLEAKRLAGKNGKDEAPF